MPPLNDNWIRFNEFRDVSMQLGKWNGRDIAQIPPFIYFYADMYVLVVIELIAVSFLCKKRLEEENVCQKLDKS